MISLQVDPVTLNTPHKVDIKKVKQSHYRPRQAQRVPGS
jgi:hypothetical protein